MRSLKTVFAAALVSLAVGCGATPSVTTTTLATDSPEVRAVPYRVLGDDISAGQPWTTSRLTTAREVELLVPGAELDWDNEIVFAFTLAESGSCPFGAVERVEYSTPDLRLYPVVPLAEDFDECTDDANPHTVVVAVDRDDVPQGEFSIWVNADAPPPGAVDGVTHFAAGELDPGDVAAGEFEPLGADGALAIGETRIAYEVTTHCGLARIYWIIDGREWVLADDSSPENLDYVPEDWRPVVTGEAIDLLIERAEADALNVTATGTDHTLTYVPALDQLGCD